MRPCAVECCQHRNEKYDVDPILPPDSYFIQLVHTIIGRIYLHPSSSSYPALAGLASPWDACLLLRGLRDRGNGHRPDLHDALSDLRRVLHKFWRDPGLDWVVQVVQLLLLQLQRADDKPIRRNAVPELHRGKAAVLQVRD